MIPARKAALFAACTVLTLGLLPHLAVGKSPQHRHPAPPKLSAALKHQAATTQRKYWDRVVRRVSPEGQAERQHSRTRYHGYGRSEAIALAHAKFADVFGQRLWRLPDMPDGFKIDRFVNDHEYFVNAPDGKRGLVQSTLPSSAIDEAGKRTAVSTALEANGSGLSPANSAAPVQIGGAADEATSFTGTGVAVSLSGARDSAVCCRR